MANNEQNYTDEYCFQKGNGEGCLGCEFQWECFFDDSQEVKQDDGKLRLELVPPGTMEAIAAVRMYGVAKYPDPTSWRRVRPIKYIGATLRHFFKFMRYYYWRDAESGLFHLDHALTNMAFLSWQLRNGLLDEAHDERFPDEKEAEYGKGG